MKKIICVAAVCLTVWACGQSSGEAELATDTLTRRQKDSLLSTAPIPGAGGIGDARRAIDQANSRTLTHDTIG